MKGNLKSREKRVFLLENEGYIRETQKKEKCFYMKNLLNLSARRWKTDTNPYTRYFLRKKENKSCKEGKQERNPVGGESSLCR